MRDSALKLNSGSFTLRICGCRRGAHARQRFETSASNCVPSYFRNVGEELMRDSALKHEAYNFNTSTLLMVGEELMRDSALKRGAEALGLGASRVGEELMRDSALKLVLPRNHHLVVADVGEELMRDSALKRRPASGPGLPGLGRRRGAHARQRFET